MSEQFNVVGVEEVNNGERGLFNALAEYLANRENAEKLNDILTNPVVTARLVEAFGEDSLIFSEDLSDISAGIDSAANAYKVGKLLAVLISLLRS